HAVNLRQIPAMAFLFNFIVSPALQLPSIKKCVKDVKIITANQKFFDEIDKQRRYEAVKAYPRLRLESPIDPHSVAAAKTPSKIVRLGMHSKALGGKWNSEFEDLIRAVNARHGAAVRWCFMGMAKTVAKTV